jgi:6-phosphofructokinase
MNAVLKGTALAAYELGWEVVGIRDGFAGLLHPERYPEGGLIPLSRDLVESLELDAGSVLGQSGMIDPFHVRRVDEDGMVEEVDESDRVLQALGDAQIDALVSVVGRRGLTLFHKLHRKGLASVCIPQSIQGDIASTMVSFGFNSALSFTIDMLDRTRQAARSARRVGVVEVLGEQAGWLALQAGIAAGADAILIPEVGPTGSSWWRKVPRLPPATGRSRQKAWSRVLSMPRSRHWPRASPVNTSSSDQATLPGRWRTGCRCWWPRTCIQSPWAPGSGAGLIRPSTGSWGSPMAQLPYGRFRTDATA